MSSHIYRKKYASENVFNDELQRLKGNHLDATPIGKYFRNGYGYISFHPKDDAAEAYVQLAATEANGFEKWTST